MELTLEPVKKVEFCPGYYSRATVIIGSIRAKAPFLPNDWKAAQDLSGLPIEITLPGPVTIGNACADDYYDNDHKIRGVEIAEA